MRTGDGFNEVHATVFFQKMRTIGHWTRKGNYWYGIATFYCGTCEGLYTRCRCTWTGTTGSLRHGVVISLRTSSSSRGLQCC